MDTIEKRLVTLQSVTKRLVAEAARIECAVQDITAAMAPSEDERDRWTLEEILKVHEQELWEQFGDRKPNDLIAEDLGLPVAQVIEARKRLQAPRGTSSYPKMMANRERNKRIVETHKAGRSYADIGREHGLSGDRVKHIITRETTIQYWVHPHHARHDCCARWRGRWCYIGAEYRDESNFLDWCKEQGLKPIRLDGRRFLEDLERRAAQKALKTELSRFRP